MLHAARLSFQHPTTRRHMTWTAPLPEDMRQWLPDFDEGIGRVDGS
jgi:hypothetical protein